MQLQQLFEIVWWQLLFKIYGSKFMVYNFIVVFLRHHFWQQWLNDLNANLRSPVLSLTTLLLFGKNGLNVRGFDGIYFSQQLFKIYGLKFYGL